MLTKAVESLIFRRVEGHLPSEAVLHLLGDGGTALDTIFTLRHGEVLELLAVFHLLEQLLTLSVVELDQSVFLLHDGLHVCGLYDDLVIILRDAVGASGRRRLRYDHQRGRLLWQDILRRGTHTDDIAVHHFQTNHLRLSTVGTDGHLVLTGLHVCSLRRHRREQDRP